MFQVNFREQVHLRQAITSLPRLYLRPEPVDSLFSRVSMLNENRCSLKRSQENTGVLGVGYIVTILLYKTSWLKQSFLKQQTKF